jgi:hypothetical protein
MAAAADAGELSASDSGQKGVGQQEMDAAAGAGAE